MSLIHQTKNFKVEAADPAHITRTDGGHIIIQPKKRISDRTKLTPKLAKELIYLSMLIGEAMQIGLNKRGIDIGRINYQENGNWNVFNPEGPFLHLHLYGRAKSAKIQKYGDACHFPHLETGFYKNNKALNQEDIRLIQKEIEKLLKKPKYRPEKWELQQI